MNRRSLLALGPLLLGCEVLPAPVPRVEYYVGQCRIRFRSYDPVTKTLVFDVTIPVIELTTIEMQIGEWQSTDA